MEVELELGVAAPPDAVAAILFDFEGLPSWHPGIEGWALEGTGEGAVRAYRLGGNAYRERLDAREEGGREIHYTVLAGPLPLQDLRATYQVRDGEDGGTRIGWRASFSVMPELGEGMAQAAKLMQVGTLELLKAHLETGVKLV